MLILREPSQITFALRGGQVVSKMLTYVYIGSVGPFENIYVNTKKHFVNFSLFFLHSGVYLYIADPEILNLYVQKSKCFCTKELLYYGFYHKLRFSLIWSLKAKSEQEVRFGFLFLLKSSSNHWSNFYQCIFVFSGRCIYI